jgi:hypothetical protein
MGSALDAEASMVGRGSPLPAVRRAVPLSREADRRLAFGRDEAVQRHVAPIKRSGEMTVLVEFRTGDPVRLRRPLDGFAAGSEGEIIRLSGLPLSPVS